MLGAFLQNCRGVWLSGDRPFYESVTGDKQVSFPTHERIDKEFRIAAANFSGGLAVNEAYASATMHGVRAFAHEMDYTGLSPEIETSVESLAGNALYRL